MNPTTPNLRHGLRAAIAVLMICVFGTMSPPAGAADDDLEFARRLTKAGEFRFAREVYESILEREGRSEPHKDQARYGLALLAKERAWAATKDAHATLDEIVRLFEHAIEELDAYAVKNARRDPGRRARLDAGAVRLAFVQWAQQLLGDLDPPRLREFDVARLRDMARRMAAEAVSTFRALRPSDDVYDPAPHQVLASYYYAVSQYYRALAESPCSPAQTAALEQAGLDLEEFVLSHDGQLLAVYAQDVYGLLWLERARCEEGREQKRVCYRRAFEWFETCIETSDLGPDYLRVITSGYLHIAELGTETADLAGSDLATDAQTRLAHMLARHPTAWRVENGLRALTAWADLECRLGNPAKAIEIANDTADRARMLGKIHVERLAGRKLRGFVSGECGVCAAGVVRPEVLARVAEDLFAARQYSKAIRAFRQVIRTTPRTPRAFMEFRWTAWQRMAQSYRQLGDRLGEAFAYEPVHDAWMAGIIPRETSGREDPNLTKAASERQYAVDAVWVVAQKTNSPVFTALQREMRAAHASEYPHHPIGSRSTWQWALDEWTTAQQQKESDDPRWRATLKSADRYFEMVASGPPAGLRDRAVVFRLRIHYLLGEHEAATAVAEAARAAWSTEAKGARAKGTPAGRRRRDGARAAIAVWQARSLLALGRHAAVADLLRGFHATWPRAETLYASMADDALVQAHLSMDDVEAADGVYRRLLERDPTYYNLSRITFLMAGHHDKRRQAIEAPLREVRASLTEARRELLLTSQEAYRIGALVSDLRLSERKANEALQLNPARIAAGLPPLDAEILEEARARIDKLEERIPELEAELAKVVSRRDELRAKAARLRREQEELEQALYEPLTKAADCYYRWDRASKAAGIDRDAENVRTLAGMYWVAGKLRPKWLESWLRARELYEDYLSLPGIQNLPISDRRIRSVSARLGGICVHLARLEQDPARRAPLVTRARELLESTIARVPADTELVIDLLANRILVLSWKDPSGARWRFPIPRPKDVPALRDSVARLGTDAGYRLPENADDHRVRAWERALRLFRRELALQDDRSLDAVIPKPRVSTFDPALYRKLANHQPEFRLALAWVYAQAGREEDVPKAVNLVLSLVAGPLAVDQDTEVWWQARSIQMEVYLDITERLAASDPGGADVTWWLERARNLYRAVTANFDDLGEMVVEGNRERWARFGRRVADAPR